MELAGAVHYVNLRTADSLVANIEWSLVDIADGYALIENALSVGNTGFNDDNGEISSKTLHGLITGRSENLTVSNISFYNFDFADSAAFGHCSHCFHPASTDSGARTATLSNMFFDDSTVPRRIRWQAPWRGIFLDLDGTLTAQGSESWATSYWTHLE